MSIFSIDPALQLEDLQRVIAKYTIRHAIEKLTLLSLGRKRHYEFASQKRKHFLSPDFDVGNNIEKVKSNLIEICRQIEYDGTFEKLQSYMMGNESQESLEREFLKNYAANKTTVKYYEEKLPIDQAALKQAELEMRVHDYMLGEMSLNSINKNQIEYRYNKSWEDARLDQLKYSIDSDERQNYFEYDRYKMLLAREEEAAKNLVDCYQSKISFLEDHLEYWTGEYERQMENIATDIHLTQDWISELERKITGQEKLYIDYQHTIEAFFIKRQKNRCARIIQRWWRAIWAEKRERKARSPRRRRSPKASPIRKKIQPKIASPKNLNLLNDTSDSPPADQLYERKNKRSKSKSSRRKKAALKF